MSVRNLFAIALAVLACLGLAAGPAAAAGPDGGDRYYVEFKQNGSDRAQAVRAAGGTVVHDFPRLGTVAAQLPDRAVQALSNNPNVLSIEVDPPRYLLAQTTPYGVPMVQADQVAEGGPGNRTVCVIDSGYNTNHEDLKSSGVTGYASGTGNWFEDRCSHGTHVAGTIAAVNNNLGIVGVTPGVNLHIVKVFGDDCSWTYSSDLVDAAYRCRDAGANVISMSLGCSGMFCRSTAEENAFNDLNNNFNILSIAAAGNDGNTQKSYPASYDSVVSVAAIDEGGNIASFSQQNDQVELAAPGVGVLSTVDMGTGANTELVAGGTAFEASAMQDSAYGTGSGALVDCGIGDTACTAAAGGVCLIQRGTISFAEKVQNCEAGGGVAAIIYNNVSGMLSGTLNGAATSIPSVGTSDTTGTSLLGKLGQSTTVTVEVGNYAFYDGTSMATPHVSAVAALVWSNDTSWTNNQIRTALQQTAQDLGASGRDNAFGYGLVQAKAALDQLTSGGSCTVTESPEVSCSDGIDNDCDFLVDAADPDCQGSCQPSGATCSANSECCSGNCKGKPGSKSCK